MTLLEPSLILRRRILDSSNREKDKDSLLRIARSTSNWNYWYLTCRKLTAKERVSEIVENLDDPEVLRNAIKIRGSAAYRSPTRSPYIDEMSNADDPIAELRAKFRILALSKR